MANLSTILEKTKSKTKRATRQPKLIVVNDNTPRPYEDNKEVSNGYQTDNKEVSNGYQTDNKMASNKVTLKQPSRKNTPKITCIDDFTGLQKKLLIVLLSLCESEYSRTTKPLNLKELAASTESNTNVVKLAIHRCKEKGVLSIHARKDGRGGWCQYKISKDLKFNQSPKTQSIYNSNNNTITKIEKNTDSLEHRSEWQELNIEPLADIGFKKSHVKQLEKLSTPEIVQESINHFTYALEHNAKVKKYDSPINVFMGVIRKGGAWIEAGYRSPHELAMEKILEARKLEKNRINKLHEQEVEMNFQDWLSQLSQEDRGALLEDFKAPKAASKPVRDRAEELFLFNYFKAEHGENIDD